MAMSPETRARCNKNLRPPRKKGDPALPGAGTRSAGRTIKEWLNSLAQRGLTAQGLKKIARDKRAPWTKRAAAERALRSIEYGDLADFDDYLTGEVSRLDELRKAGINTAVVKKARTKIIPTETGNIEEREVELYDRAGADFDRILDYTEGKPKNTLDIGGDLPASITFNFPPIADDDTNSDAGQ